MDLDKLLEMMDSKPEEQLRHLLTQAQANRAQADEHFCDKPCRFLKESVRDSEVSGVPVGVRQRCAHPVFEQRSIYSLLTLYAEMLNVTEKFCEAMVKAKPDVLESLPTARRIALASSQSLLITPRENNRDLIVSYLESLDFLRKKVAVVIDEMKKNHALTVSDDRYFTNEPGRKIHNEQTDVDRGVDGSGGNSNGP